MRNVILGTDWWTDCDDAVAVRLLANLHRAGHLRLLGVAVSGCMEDSVRSLDAFLRDCGVEVPIGIDLEATDFGGRPPYQKRLAALPSRFGGNADAENPVGLYRRLLAASCGPVELIEIGYPQILAALLDSPADAYSPLDGESLVRAKVSRLWIMAGKWDEPDGGRENNFARNRRASAAAAHLCDRWPTPVTFLGWEVGSTGRRPAQAGVERPRLRGRALLLGPDADSARRRRRPGKGRIPLCLRYGFGRSGERAQLFPAGFRRQSLLCCEAAPRRMVCRRDRPAIVTPATYPVSRHGVNGSGRGTGRVCSVPGCAGSPLRGRFRPAGPRSAFLPRRPGFPAASG